MRCALVGCSCYLRFVRLVQQEQAGVVFALEDVKALIARFLNGFLVIQDGGLRKLRDPFVFHVEVNAGDVHRRPVQR